MTAVAEAIVDRVEAIDWAGIEAALDARGFAPLPAILDAVECEALAGLYSNGARFRSRIDMSRFRFGAGEYKYFAAPLPPLVQAIREELYARLAPIANRWQGRLGRKAAIRNPQPAIRNPRFPPALADFLALCHERGQSRPTPLLLSYAAGGHNCLHQDIYGDLAFPLQAVFGLSRAGIDYEGGELLLVEQRPRAQSRGEAARIEQGAGIVFATRERPVAGARGDYRVTMRHGVSTITRGTRMTLGVIFHDAR
jgi:hypothetical protein